MVGGTLYPPLMADAAGRADHGLAMALFWAMSAGFVRGVGFVPRRWVMALAVLRLGLRCGAGAGRRAEAYALRSKRVLPPFARETSGAVSYLLADLDAGEAVLVDPRAADVPVLSAMLDEQRLRLRWLLRTHEHDDMIAGESLALEGPGRTAHPAPRLPRTRRRRARRRP